MTQEEIKDILQKTGAIRTGHFKRASGRHTNYYVQCARLFEDAKTAEPVCRALADKFRDSGANVVMSAAVGGVILCYEVAKALNLRNIFAERRDGALLLRRGFTLGENDRVLILEDEIATGTSVREMIEIVRAKNAKVVAIGCIIDKSGGEVAFDYPFTPLVSIDMENYRQSECPMCAEEKPIDLI